jgi:hypothetical protein
MIDCIWRGTLYMGLCALYVAGLIGILTFVTWGFADPSEVNLWGAAARLALVVWLFAIGTVCASKRWGGGQ